jgi:hypothetical protein
MPVNNGLVNGAKQLIVIDAALVKPEVRVAYALPKVVGVSIDLAFATVMQSGRRQQTENIR